MADKILKREFMVKPSECNAQQSLPLSLLVTQLIDLATDHANQLGIGFLELEPKGLGWVLSRLSVEMERWPGNGETYILSTWVESYNAHFSERCFSIVAGDNEVIGYARTIWMIIDLSTHQSVGTGGTHLPEELIAGALCPIAKGVRHKPFVADKESEYTFKYSDLDFYRHVNTVRYISLLLNQFTLEEFDSNILSRFDVAFAHEAKYGETALIRSIEEETQPPSMLKRKSDSKKRIMEISVGETLILSSSITLSKVTG